MTQILKEYPMHPIRNRYQLKQKWETIKKKAVTPETAQIIQSIENSHDTSSFSFPDQKFHDELSLILPGSEIIPLRHAHIVKTLLESPINGKRVMSEWMEVVNNPEKLFTFIKRIRQMATEKESVDST